MVFASRCLLGTKSDQPGTAVDYRLSSLRLLCVEAALRITVHHVTPLLIELMALTASS